MSRNHVAGPEYDVVIVGGGSAGAVLAARLSERPERSVLLIEAGPAHRIGAFPATVLNASTPGGDATTLWDVPAPDTQGTGHADTVVRAKVLGGGSAINVGVAVRALPSDFARWTHRGLIGWTYQDVLPYYRKMETTEDGAEALHGRSGPIRIGRVPAQRSTPLHRAFVEACLDRGFPPVDDFNGLHPEGVGQYPMNVVDGIRQSTALAYLNAEVRNRSNLRIADRTTVNRVLVERGTAVGIQTSTGTAIRAAQTVLSAGAVGSAEILLRSGIGPAIDLAELGIPVTADLPVGRHVREHPCAYVLFASTPQRLGTTTPPVSTLLWTRSSLAAYQEPDLHLAASHLVHPTAFPDRCGFGFLIAVGRPEPQAHGILRLTTSNPSDPARLELNLLSHPRDLLKLIEAVHISRDIAATAPLRDLIVRESAPGPQAVSQADLAAYLRANVKPYPHLCGTTPMGTANDPAAVVDSTGRIHGITALRVIDASIFPDIPSAATNPTVIMTAEILADRFNEST